MLQPFWKKTVAVLMCTDLCGFAEVAFFLLNNSLQLHYHHETSWIPYKETHTMHNVGLYQFQIQRCAMQSSNRKLDSKKATTDSLDLDLSNQYQIFIANPVICIRSMFALQKITEESLFLKPVGISAVGFNLRMHFWVTVFFRHTVYN